ncbi:MAG: sigma 54-interacting transcriptional regulator [Planctomycetes bacterium]|nr:sigma 54-interacting transcriptional regulator [Planctomycetota bacterium]
MKKKRLADYGDLIQNAIDRNNYPEAKRYADVALKNLASLPRSPLEEFRIYEQSGRIYYGLGEYTRSLDAYYKSYLFASKNLAEEPGYAINCLSRLGYTLIALRNIRQALAQFQKAQAYCREFEGRFLLSKEKYIHLLIGVTYCYLYLNDFARVGEILEKEVHPVLPSISDKYLLLDYYHFKGEYLYNLKDYGPAKESFNRCVVISEEINLSAGVLEAKVHLAMIDLLEKQVPAAIAKLQDVVRTGRRQKYNEVTCEAMLLLGKAYSLGNSLLRDHEHCEAGGVNEHRSDRDSALSDSVTPSTHRSSGQRRSDCDSEPDRSISVEKQIKPLLNKVDVGWLYERIKEFNDFYKQLQEIYSTSRDVPHILISEVDKHYKSASYKNIIVGKSPAMHEVYQVIDKIAPTDLPVLVQGETGTGKELICRLIHRKSARSEKPYLALNCGAMPENLLENELFGHTAGAYTGATEDKKGYVELASGGTLMLDEITNMSVGMQQKLLRVLEEQSVWPLGAEKPVPVDVRFIFASNQNVEQMMAKGLMRSDLFYRINIIIITLPPLRERREDIPLLIEHFMGKYAAVKGSSLGISHSALEILTAYAWPGNVRELENEIQRLCVLHQDEKVITEEMLAENIRYTPPTTSPRLGRDGVYPALGGTVAPQEGKFKSPLIRGDKGVCYRNGKTLVQLRDEFERQVIREAIKEHNGNVAEASRQLGYDRPSLYRKMKQLGIK